MKEAAIRPLGNLDVKGFPYVTDDYLADVVAAGEPQERATEVLLDADAGSGVLT